MDLLTQIKASADFILKQSKYKPEIGLILGSGLGSLADSIESLNIIIIVISQTSQLLL